MGNTNVNEKLILVCVQADFAPEKGGSKLVDCNAHVYFRLTV